jgi:hypothetical protein
MSARTRRTAFPDLITVAKDLILFSIGTSMMVYQGFVVRAQEFNLSILIFGGVIAGVPGVLKLWGLRADMTAPSSRPASEQSGPSS